MSELLEFLPSTLFLNPLRPISCVLQWDLHNPHVNDSSSAQWWTTEQEFELEASPLLVHKQDNQTYKPEQGLRYVLHCHHAWVCLMDQVQDARI